MLTLSDLLVMPPSCLRVYLLSQGQKRSMDVVKALLRCVCPQVDGGDAGRQHDIELLHLASGMLAAANMLAAMAAGHPTSSTLPASLSSLERLQHHFNAIRPGAFAPNTIYQRSSVAQS